MHFPTHSSAAPQPGGDNLYNRHDGQPAEKVAVGFVAAGSVIE